MTVKSSLSGIPRSRSSHLVWSIDEYSGEWRTQRHSEIRSNPIVCRSEPIDDLDWTSTPDMQSILAVGFRHHVELLCQQRMTYFDEGPRWTRCWKVEIGQYVLGPMSIILLSLHLCSSLLFQSHSSVYQRFDLACQWVPPGRCRASNVSLRSIKAFIKRRAATRNSVRTCRQAERAVTGLPPANVIAVSFMGCGFCSRLLVSEFNEAEQFRKAGVGERYHRQSRSRC